MPPLPPPRPNGRSPVGKWNPPGEANIAETWKSQLEDCEDLYDIGTPGRGKHHTGVARSGSSKRGRKRHATLALTPRRRIPRITTPLLKSELPLHLHMTFFQFKKNFWTLGEHDVTRLIIQGSWRHMPHSQCQNKKATLTDSIFLKVLLRSWCIQCISYRSVNFERCFDVSNFLQKMNKGIWLYYYDTSNWFVFVRFFKEIKDTKKSFQIYLTFATRTSKVIIEKSSGGRFLWNRNWHLGRIRQFLRPVFACFHWQKFFF